jgi:hypothetical protein
MRRTVSPPSSKTDPDDPADDWVWGAEKIGQLIGRSTTQVYYLHSSGLLRGATFKLGRKTLVGSRSKLRALPDLLASETT